MKKKTLNLAVEYKDRAKYVEKKFPQKDSSVEEIKLIDVFQYVPGTSRAKFMEEIYRILVPKGKATIVVSYYSCAMAYADPLVQWPPVNEQSFLFFNKEWLSLNNIDFKINCDFDYVYGYVLPPDLASRSQEVQAEFIKSKWNTVPKLQVTLTKK